MTLEWIEEAAGRGLTDKAEGFYLHTNIGKGGCIEGSQGWCLLGVYFGGL